MDRKAEIDGEKAGLATIEKAGVKINEVKDLKPFQARMQPAYDLVGAKVGKAWLDQVMAAVKAAE